MLVGAQDGGQRTDLALAEAVEEVQVRQAFTQSLQDGDGHDRGPVERLPQSAEVAGGELGVVGEGDPHGGRGEEGVAQARFDEVEDTDGVRSVQDGVLRAHRQIGQQEHVHLCRVVERQGVHGPVGGGEAERGDRADVLVDQGPVRHHRALGQGGGAGGVQQLHQIVGGGRAPGGEGPLRPQGVEQRAGSVPQGAHGAARGEPTGEVRVGQHEGGAGLVEQVEQVVTGEVLVDRDVDEATGHRRGSRSDRRRSCARRRPPGRRGPERAPR